MFQKLAQAYKLLTDGPARAAYDVWLKAKDAAKQRNKDLSAKRRKLKEGGKDECDNLIMIFINVTCYSEKKISQK